MAATKRLLSQGGVGLLLNTHIRGKLEGGWEPIQQQGKAAEHKLERVASWRQLQGYSQQLHLMGRYCQPPLSLASFHLPQDFHIRPVASNEQRGTVALHSTSTSASYFVNKVSKERIRILPDSPVLAPLLVIMLDQGGPGMAGVSYMNFKLNMMVFGKYDKIHRLIRDLKGAENGCCGKIFTKTKLWSAYLYSLNKRPFGSGANATEKSCLMNVFANTVFIDSPVFLKHLSAIARAWKMPSDTPLERQAILTKVLDMGSFRKHLSHPKLANWFAWNDSADQQMKEFFAAKMVYESQLFDSISPAAWLDCVTFVCPSCLLHIVGGGVRKLDNTNPAGHHYYYCCMFCFIVLCKNGQG